MAQERIYSIERWFEFDAGHRVTKHAGKCCHLHGHRYKVGFILEGKLNEQGFVMDFGYLKTLWGDWLNANLDHGLILESNDSRLGNSILLVDRQAKIYYMPESYGATAEDIARHLFERLGNLVTGNCRLCRVEVYETPSCMGSYGNDRLATNERSLEGA